MDKALDTPKNLNFDKRLLAKFLYWMGWRISSIADYIDEPDKNVHAWKTRDEWDKDAPAGRVGEALTAQLIKLIILEKKHLVISKKLICSCANWSAWHALKNFLMVVMKPTSIQNLKIEMLVHVSQNSQMH
ncbi:hypothetical protein MKR65_05735 [Acinetobacter baumannii]